MEILFRFSFHLGHNYTYVIYSFLEIIAAMYVHM